MSTSTGTGKTGGTAKPVLEFKTKKFVLQQLLEKAATVVPTKDIMPVLKYFCVSVTDGSAGEGLDLKGKVEAPLETVMPRLEVRATDLQLSVLAHTFLVSVQTPGVAYFPARKLLEAIKEAHDDDVTVCVTSTGGTGGSVIGSVIGTDALVKVGRTRWTFKLPDGSGYPPPPAVEKMGWVLVGRQAFLSCLKSVSRAASTETHRANLMLVDVSNGRMRASDGVRFQQRDIQTHLVSGTSDGPISVPDMQIPIYAVPDLVKVLASYQGDTFVVAQDDNCVMFGVGEDIFVSQKLDAAFPDMDAQVLKPALANTDELLVDRDEFIAALRRVRVTVNPETAAVSLLLTTAASGDGGRMEVSSRDKLGSRCTEVLDVGWEGPDRSLAFNVQHLLDMLTMSDPETSKTCHFFVGPASKTKPSPLLLRDEDAGQVGVLNQVRADWLE